MFGIKIIAIYFALLGILLLIMGFGVLSISVMLVSQPEIQEYLKALFSMYLPGFTFLILPITLIQILGVVLIFVSVIHLYNAYALWKTKKVGLYLTVFLLLAYVIANSITISGFTDFPRERGLYVFPSISATSELFNVTSAYLLSIGYDYIYGFSLKLFYNHTILNLTNCIISYNITESSIIECTPDFNSTYGLIFFNVTSDEYLQPELVTIYFITLQKGIADLVITEPMLYTANGTVVPEKVVNGKIYVQEEVPLNFTFRQVNVTSLIIPGIIILYLVKKKDIFE